jgi:two-component system chemotaxis sensor kinase CheA
MAFDVDDEILADFLVEAGEIIELLQGQLVELENNPEDSDLLNAIFRGYHTVKGGAGFLSLTELVDICHCAENVFDVMRNGQRSYTPELMDTILQATDEVVQMLKLVKAGEPQIAAKKSLVDTLTRLSKPESSDKAASANEPKSAGDVTTTHHDLATVSGEDEFEALLDELHGSDTPAAKEKAAVEKNTLNDQDMSDDEFEALLDQLYGKGQFKSEKKPEDETQMVKSAPLLPAKGSSGGDISDDEFEALLDQLYGKGKVPADDVPEKSAAVKITKLAVMPAEVEKVVTPPNIVDFSSSIAAKKEDKKPFPSQAETTVRVDTKRLDQIMNMVGELVLVRNRLLNLSHNVNDESMAKAITNLDVVTGDLQGAVMKTRMQPIKKVFGRFPRVVRDLARTLKKEITLVLEGEETDLDKNLVEALADPLVHLVRNSVDHGIEMPQDRKAAGKPTTGIVKLSASQEGDHILLSIIDDGKGMDPDKLKGIAISRGVMDADTAARMTDSDAFNLIFAPGFSTKTKISQLSGRGVGMDVVKTKINQLNGSINIDSKMGIGTTLEIKVPLTLAILPTLMIVIGEQTFALPLVSVNEIINLDMQKINTVDGQLTMIVRSKAIPLFYLGEWLSKGEVNIDKTKGHVVVVQIGTKQLGFVVDALIGQEEVVIKPLDALLQGTPGMAGATITSDGGIALILDVPGLLKRYATKKA